MYRILVTYFILILLIPFTSFADEQPKIQKEFPQLSEEQSEVNKNNPNELSKFSEDLAELYIINEEFRKTQQMLAAGGDKEAVKKIMSKALEKLREMKASYDEKSPVILRGFSIGFPLGITIDFEIDISKL